MSAKDFLLDKSKKVVKGTAKTGVRFAKGTVKTSKIAYDTADKLTVTGSNYVADMLINYTPDFYDEQQDVATDTGKVVGALGLQVARTGARSRRSVYNKVNKHKVKSLNRQAKFFNTTLQKKEAILQNTPELSSETKRSLQNQIRSDRRQIKRLERKTGKVQRKIREDLAFHPMQSTKAMLTNQSRKMLSTIGRGDDMGSKVVSKVGIGAWGTLKYRQRVKQTVIKTFSIVKSAVAGMIGFITSVPAMIVAVLSSVPVIIILVCVVAIFSFLELIWNILDVLWNSPKIRQG